ncbi:Protein of unknown function (DUF1573) [Belliella baltica DSM 15883]|uniref:DUF1573 domain-containing protein n=1 Tax=Belliella baltica (strain DSM 15883 / CIP 108006 / LMG 21964 / BA134) TaxID=866536 RepID=I3Z8J6_BELBD|nr:DUF1573 domain-containing protein [Belliella baltica]AFL85564.1 Protein of unknown function (DUF1573) [Belliella baltica DSM 15883]
MIKLKTQLLLVVLVVLSMGVAEAQDIERKLLFWENRTIDIGTVLEENGLVEVEFLGLNQTDSAIIISDIITDCGCTTAAFSQDTIYQSKVGSIKVNFNPDHRGGAFTKMIIVRTNQDIYGDTLYLQGFNIPFPDNLEAAYPYKNQDIGMRLSSINMGNVYTHEPRRKMVELYNFGKDSVSLTSIADSLPDYLKIDLQPLVLAPNQRGLLIIDYDGQVKNDFGLVEEELSLNFSGKENPLSLRLIANIFEYFEPVLKSMENIVPRLGINEIDIDLKNINSDQIIRREIKLSNQGEEVLEIRKVITNCSCLEVKLEKESLMGGESMNLSYTFDPEGRRGIDHKHIMLFTNDPIQPVRTIVIRSMIK